MTTPGLAAALRAEHAAVYVIGTLGGRASTLHGASGLETDLYDAYNAHLELRETLIRLCGGANAVPSQPAYELPKGITSTDGIRTAALRVEEHCTAALLDAVGEVTGRDRDRLVDALGDTAVRQLAFGGSAAPFPGS